MRIDKNTTIRLGDRNIVKVKIGDSVIWQKQQDNTDYLYIQNTYSGSNTITFTTTQSGTPASGTYATSVECSKNKSTWNTIHFDTSNPQTITLEQGEKLYLRNNTGVFNFHDVRNGTVDYYTSITSTNTINVGGNTNSLFDYTNMSGVDVSSTVGGLCRLFSHSVNLINANDIVIPQTTYPDFFADEMFTHCESLVTAPNLNNVVNIGYASCSQMFGYCYSLVTPPDFNSVTYTGPRSGFSWCFYDCNSLTRTPSFNSLTSIGPLGFNRAFTNCSNLTDIMFDTSNITSLPESALSMSFMNTKIETGLYLGNVTELGKSSLYQLYRNCSFLSAVYCPNVSSWDTSITNNWLSGAGTSVSGTKTAYKYSNISIPTSDSGIPSGWTVVGPDYFYIESLGDGNTISVKNQGDGSTDNVTPTLEYSTDKNTWNTITFDWTYGTHTTELPVKLNTGEKMYFRNDTRLFSNSYNKYITFSSSVSSNVGGDIRTLSNYLDVNSETTVQSYMFANLFYNNKIVNASNLRLSYTTLASYCYRYMFYNCSSLTTAPELPATTLAESCYSSMFESCTSLTTAPSLPATTLVRSCYNSMFSGCTSLTTAPALPATTLVGGCYSSMFRGCTSLTTAPVLPATTLAGTCYISMFRGCTSLTTAPVLPANTLQYACYDSMFYGCTSLTTAPVLPATTLAGSCYNSMFYGCTKLNSITVYAQDISATDCTTNWLSGVASTGTFHNMGFVTYKKDSINGIPVGWTEVVPEIQSITVNPDTFTIEFNDETVTCNSTLELATTMGTITTTNSVTFTVGENTGDTTRTLTKTIPYFNSSYDVTIVQSAIQSITVNPDTFTIKSYKDTAKCTSTLTIATTIGTTVTDTNSATVTVGENTGDTTRTLTETIPYKGSSYQVTIVQTANDVKPTLSWNVVSTGTYPFQLNTNGYYESTNKGHNSSYSYATLNYSGYENLVLECINSGESNYDYGIISQPDVLLSESTSDDGATGSTKVFKNFQGQSSTNPVQLTIPSDEGSHFITIKFRKDSSSAEGNDSLQFKVIEP